MRKSDWVSLTSVREVLELVDELASLPLDSNDRDARMIDRLTAIVGGAIGGVGSTHRAANTNTPLWDVRTSGLTDAMATAISEPYVAKGTFSNPMVPSLYLRMQGTASSYCAGSTRQLVDRAQWYGSDYYNGTLRKFGFDEHLLAIRYLPKRGAQFIGFMRERGDSEFGIVEVRLLEFFMERVDAHERALDAYLAGLTPRQVETYDAMMQGLSEKEIADRMQVSTHTVHSYVKAIYRMFCVRSRAELMAHRSAFRRKHLHSGTRAQR